MSFIGHRLRSCIPFGRRKRKTTLYADLKNAITTRQAAELYGFAISRNGMMCCPFHADKHPSMKVDSRFHCFACQADGDVIDFVSRLFQLSPRQAVEKLTNDFGISRAGGKVRLAPRSPAEAAGILPQSATLAGLLCAAVTGRTAPSPLPGSLEKSGLCEAPSGRSGAPGPADRETTATLSGGII